MISIIDSDELKHVLRPTIFLPRETRCADAPPPPDETDTDHHPPEPELEELVAHR